MFTRPWRGAALAAVFAAAVLALPACDKKKKTGDSPAAEPPSHTPQGPQGGQQGSPPGSFQGRALLGTANARTRSESEFNLKQIGLAFHNAHDQFGAFPEGIADGTGKPGLSWRVALLPFVEQQNLYNQFKLNEPWDSEHNKKLIPLMPKVYAPPGVDTNGNTYYRSFSGPDTVMPPRTGTPGAVVKGASMLQISDGTSNTLLVAEAAEPVVWTKPDELPFAPGKPPKLGGGVFANGFCVVLCDGSPRFIPNSIDARTLGNAIQINDGNPVEFPQ
jgi:hypothetical protein